ncbi:hypothetical protein JHL18_20745 [Clostridium sp. YIM B02505]|uniref:Uncharacterized protein n=1 Tax=Clostridium yunnanense TaxID=2800325 RepID=A0ABS1EUJ7_9CLOT|nr:hypothetical protein [Clostridium yunnanense]MBK1813053.1 hypothetical protein [Clostridium yunnanense]
MKYEVDKRMNRVVAYDDNNFVLSYSFEENKGIGDNNTTMYTMNGIYTLVQNGRDGLAISFILYYEEFSTGKHI